jgi:Right handed beta helix region
MVKKLHKVRRFLEVYPRRFDLLLLLVLSLGLSFCIRAANQPDSQKVQTRAQVGSQGRIYHVRQRGSGDCSVPQDCIGRLQPGDTLLIHAGTYSGFSIGDLSGTAGAPITIKGAPGEHAILDGYLGKNSSYGMLGVIDGHSPSYVVIGDSDGQLEITNTDPFIDQLRQLDMGKQNDVNTYKSQYLNDPRIQMGGFQLEGGNHAHHLTFQYLTIHHFFGGGLPGTQSDTNYLYNTVYDLGYPHSGYGCYCNGARQVFRGNIIHDVTIGLHLYDGSGSSPLTDSVVENNLIYNISLKPWYHGSSGHVYKGGQGIVVWPGSKNTIQHNIVYAAHGPAIQVYNGSGNKVWYNTLYANESGLLQDSAQDVKNNIFYHNQHALHPEGVATIGAGNYMSGPQFINAPSDFHLKAGSPAKTAASDGGEAGAYGGGIRR